MGDDFSLVHHRCAIVPDRLIVHLDRSYLWARRWADVMEMTHSLPLVEVGALICRFTGLWPGHIDAEYLPSMYSYILVHKSW